MLKPIRLSRSWQHWYLRALPAYWVFMFCAMHFPKPRLSHSVYFNDKVLHFLSYGLLTFLVWRFVQAAHGSVPRRFVWFAWVLLALYGIVDEYLQQFVNRSTSALDWLADVIGIGITLLALEVYRRLSERSDHPPAPANGADRD